MGKANLAFAMESHALKKKLEFSDGPNKLVESSGLQSVLRFQEAFKQEPLPEQPLT